MAISDARQLLGTSGAPVPDAVRSRLAAAGVLVCGAAVLIAGAGASSDAAFGRAFLQFLIVGLPIAAGLYALRAPVNRGFGLALLTIGFAWSLTSLGESTLSVPYTVGRLATWLVFPCAFYLLMTFPDGRLGSTLDRVLFGVMVFTAVVLFYGTAPLVEAYPAKTLWATCTTDCPSNALFVLDAQPAFMSTVVLVREYLVELIWAGTFVSMNLRWRRASPMQRRTLAPVFGAAIPFGLSHIAFHTARQLGAPIDTVVLLSSVWTACIVALCCAFLIGLVRYRMELAGALTRLGAALRRDDDPARVRDALATALSDSTMQLLFRDRLTGTWRDAAGGEEASWPRAPEPGRAATEVDGDDGQPDVVLLHDVALLDDPELLDGVSGVVLAGWRHERLLSDLARAMGELEESRRRIAEAADLERARIERDLHDGAQQRLIALRIRLGLAEDLLEMDPTAGMREVHDLGFEAERALEELRSLAHGVYPSMLTDRGIEDALRSVARQAPMRVVVDANGVTRHPIELESAVYFTCAEALQNAVKHAADASVVWIRLSETSSSLRFEVCDDGAGFASGTADGRGLRNMRDRIEAIGGTVAVESAPGHGTCVSGAVTLPG